MKKEKNVEQNVSFCSKQIIINGEPMEIIPAFTKYSAQRSLPEEIKGLVDNAKILSQTFSFAKPEIFRKEDVTLYDLNGNVIPKDEDGRVLVFLDTPNTINLIDILTDPLPSEIVECTSVADAYRRVGMTNALAHNLTKRDWIGYCEATTSENVFAQIREFASGHKMSATTAQAYFGLRFTTNDLKKSTMSCESLFGDKIKFRRKEDATRLYEAMKGVLGVKAASQTRYAKGLNTSLSMYSIEEVIDSLWNFPKKVIDQVLNALSQDKESTLSARIGEYVKKEAIFKTAS